jgi:putative transposase
MFDMAKVVKRAYKYRFYPTPEQAAELSRTFGCVRKVWNLALQARTAAWCQRRERVTYVQSSALLTGWKRSGDLAYLNEVSSVPLQQALRHLQSAFARFWDSQARYPRFKSRKKSRAAAEYTRSGFRYRGGQLHLAKMTGPLAVVWSRPLPAGAEPSTVTVSRDPAGRWFVSLLCQCPVEPHPASAAVAGVDAGITSLVTLSTGEKIPDPRHERRDRARLALALRRLARTRKGSANRDKARLKVARVHARIAGRRRDFLHKLTTWLVRENQVGRDRGSERAEHGPQPSSGPRDLGCGVAADAGHAGVQMRMVRAGPGGDRPLVPLQQGLPGLRAHGCEPAARRPRVGMRELRHPA